MWSPETRSEIMNGPLETDGLLYSGECAMLAGWTFWKVCIGIGPEAPSAMRAINVVDGLRSTICIVLASTFVTEATPIGSPGSVVGKPNVLANAGFAYRL